MKLWEIKVYSWEIIELEWGESYLNNLKIFLLSKPYVGDKIKHT